MEFIVEWTHVIIKQTVFYVFFIEGESNMHELRGLESMDLFDISIIDIKNSIDNWILVVNVNI